MEYDKLVMEHTRKNSNNNHLLIHSDDVKRKKKDDTFFQSMNHSLEIDVFRVFDTVESASSNETHQTPLENITS